MKKEDEVLWRAKNGVSHNFGDLKTGEGGNRLKLQELSGINRVSPFAILLFSMVTIPFTFFVVSIWSVIFAAVLSCFFTIYIIYWVFIREIKYFQIV